MKKKIIVVVAIVAVLSGAFFFAEKPPETVQISDIKEERVTSQEEKSVIEESIASQEETSVVEKSIALEEETSAIEESVVSQEEVSVIEESITSQEETSVVEESIVSQEEASAIEESIVSQAESSEYHSACTISISCHTLLDNLDKIKKNKIAVIPSDGNILTSVPVEFEEGESVFDVTKRVCMDNRIPFEFTIAPVYHTAYIEGINNLYEFDCGSTSGWLYKVNGEFKSYGCSDCQLQDGDIIEWVYTCNLGKDVGNDYQGE